MVCETSHECGATSAGAAVPARVVDVAASMRTGTSSPGVPGPAEVDRGVASGPASSKLGVGAARALDEDLLHPADPLLVSLARDPLHDLDQAFDAVPLDLLGHLIGHGCGFRAAPGAVHEGEGAVVADLLHDLERLAEVVLGLPREPDDHVGREREVRDRVAEPADERQVAIASVRAAHRA